jgi:hypothetical protein
MLGGFLIDPPEVTVQSANTTIVYLHGAEFNPKSKLERLMEFSYAMNCQILVINYRGYAYSQNASCSEAKIQLDA